MRKIKFRGKDIENEQQWRYGWFIAYPNGACIIVEFDNCDNELAYDVDPETVGQFTGLYDRHGEEIYEGDILTYGYDNVINPTPLVVEYKHGAFGYVYVEGNFYSFAGISSFTFNPFDEDDRFEVIGNIYDNPELFKGM